MINKPSLSSPSAKQSDQQSSQLDATKQSTEFTYVLNLNELMDYFKSIKVTSISQKKSDFYTYERFIHVTQQIYNDETQVNQISTNIDSLLVKEKITQQEEKTNELKSKKLQILQQLALLDDQVSRSKRQKVHSREKINLSMDVSRISSKDNEQQHDQTSKKLIFSRQQHKQLVLKIVKQRQQRERNRLILKQKQQEKLKKIQEEQRQLQLKKIEQEKRKKAEEIQQKLKKKKEKHEKFIQEEKQSQKKVQQIKHKKFLYEEITQKFELNVKMPLLQEQKKILKEKRQFAKAYSIDEIKNHQKAYLQLRQSSMKKSQAKEIVKGLNIDQHSKGPIKSSRLQKILQEQKLQQRTKLMQKKRAVQQKLQRQQNYVEYLKQNFSKIKIDKSKQQEIRNRLQKMNVKREDIDSRAIGINYLQQAKKMRRKTAQLGHQTEKQENSNENTNNITVLSEHAKKSNAVSQSRIADDIRRNNLMKKRQQKIQILIHDSTLNQSEKIKKLKMQTQRINEAFKMKEEMLKYGYSQRVEQEAVELLLTSIQAKMGIIDISKEKQMIAS